MQYSWLEKMANDGHISERAKKAIYEDCSLLVDKLASAGSSAEHLNNLKSYGTKILDQVGTYAILGGIAALGKTLFDKMEDSKTVKNIIKNRTDIMSLPEVELHKEKAGARFDELVRLSPQVALSPDLSKRLVVGALHSGFTDSDALRISALQAGLRKDLGVTAGVEKKYEKRLKKSAELIGKTAADILQITKEASAKSEVVKPLLHSIAALTGAHLLLGAGVGTTNVIRRAVDKRSLENKLRSSFEEAIRQSDPQKEQLLANKDKAYKSFQTLAHFAPSVATDPSAARAFMNSMMSFDIGTPLGAIKDLSDIEKNLKGTRGASPFFEGFSKSIETTGVGRSFGQAVEHTMKPHMEMDLEVAGGNAHTGK